MSIQITYKVDGVEFSAHGVWVSGSEGIIDALEIKEPLVMDWPDIHGEIIDARKPIYKPRDITLHCVTQAIDNQTLEANIYNFRSLFGGAALKQLTIGIGAAHPLVYMVYLRRGIKVQKKWRADGDVIAQLSIHLREPEPVKRVLAFSGTDVNISATCPSPLSIFWGDGTSDEGLPADAGLSYQHKYTTEGTKYIVITGNIEDISAFSSNAAVIWNRLY